MRAYAGWTCDSLCFMSAKKAQGELSYVGGMTLDTHGRPHGLRPHGLPSPQDEALQGTTLLGASRKILVRYPENATRSVRIRMIT